MNKTFTFLAFILILLASCDRTPDTVDEGKVIVLMYHRITEGAATNLYERSAADLEGDLKYLREKNIRVIDFSELNEMVLSGQPPATDCAVLTFDDGDHSWLTLVTPLLSSYRVPATFFLWASMIEEERASFLSWDEVELMSHYMDYTGRRPFVFGSHSLYHQYLLEKKSVYPDPADYAAYLDEELGGSRILIEKHTPLPVNILSLPFGDGAGDPDIIAGAERNGYSFIRTSEWGAFDVREVNLMRIPSLPMLDATDPELISYYLGQ